MWPFRKAETRAADTTDVVIAAILAGANGDIVTGLTAGVETAAGFWQRGFSSASVEPDGIVADALAPHLGSIGRQLCVNGQIVFEIVIDGGFSLRPAHTVSVVGGTDPEEWQYQLTIAGPSISVTRTLPASRVLHLTYSTNPSHPWRGIGPIEAGGTTKALLSNLESRLAQETGGAVGQLIPVPNVQVSGGLQAEIRGMKGEIALVDSVSATKWGAGSTGAGFSEYPYPANRRRSA